MQLPPAAEGFVDGISQELKDTPDIPTAILAGHQILDENGKYSPILGVFPEVTWAMGKRVIESTRDSMKDIRLFTVINDWTNIRGKNSVSRRIVYWQDASVNIEPELEPHLVPGFGIGSAQIKGMFSEKALQNRFTRIFPKAKEACDTAGCDFSFNKCSSEVVMIVRELYRQNIRRLIAFMPNICRQPISYASNALGEGQFRLDDDILKEAFYIQNIYLRTFGTNTAEDVIENAEIERVSTGSSN